MHSPPPALVLGGYLTVLGTLRCLATAGIERHCLTRPEDYVRASRYHCGPPGGAEAIASPDQLRNYLEALPLDAGVLIPCSDEWALACAGLESGLRERFAFSGPSLEVLRALLDKGLLEEQLRVHGIERPRTRGVEDEGDLAWLENEPEATWFLKPADSQAFRRQFGRKALRVSSVAEAAAVLGRCRELGLTMLLQEYIPGPADRHHLVDGFVDSDGELRAMRGRRRIRMYPHDFGDSSFLISLEIEELAEAAEACRRLLTQGQFRGIFSAEFKQDPRDERFKLIEVNARPWAYVQFAQSCGFNAPAMAYRDALGIPQETPAPNRAGARFQILPNDLKAARDYQRRGELGVWSWIRQSWGAESAIFKVGDPLPAVTQWGSTLGNQIRKVLSRGSR